MAPGRKARELFENGTRGRRAIRAQRHLDEQFMSYVFISYLRSEHELIEPFLSALDREGIEVWIDREGLELGHDWKERIARAINKADAFVLFASRDLATRSDSFVHQELAIASEYAEGLPQGFPWYFPVLLDSGATTPKDSDKTNSLSRFQYLEAHREQDAPQALAHRLSKCLSDKAFRTAQLSIRCKHVKNKPDVLIDDKPSGHSLPYDGLYRMRVSALAKTLRLRWEWYYDNPNDPYGDGWRERNSNVVSLNLSPGDNVVILAEPDGLFGLGEAWKIQIISD